MTHNEMDMLIKSAQSAAKNMDTFLASMDRDLDTWGSEAPVEAAYAHVCIYVLPDSAITPEVKERLKDYLPKPVMEQAVPAMRPQVKSFCWADFHRDRQFCADFLDWLELYRQYENPEIRKEIRKAMLVKLGVRGEMALVYGWEDVHTVRNLDHHELMSRAIDDDVDPNEFVNAWILCGLRLTLTGSHTELGKRAIRWGDKHKFPNREIFHRIAYPKVR